MSLEAYKQKRDFVATSEPEGMVSSDDGRRFVVQEHHASHLHWDLRLEMGGVLKSWAVPKGMPLEPNVKRLAVQTEDHPVEYLTFHGTIPKGSYGAGEMTIWDTGTYEMEAGADPDPERAVAKGKVSIIFHGGRLDGFWELIKTKQENQWILFRNDRAPARFARDITRVAGAIESPMPRSIDPMLATAADKPFSHPDWVFEIKWDGYRAVCFLENGAMRLMSRNQLPLNDKFPELRGLEKDFEAQSAIVDGEIVGLGEDGKPSFQFLQNRGFRGSGPRREPGEMKPHVIVYQAFDLLYLDGYDLTRLPLTRRKEMLRAILRPSGLARFSDHVAEKGIELFEMAASTGLEGVVAKLASSPYVQKRSDYWRKLKALQTADVVIGGYTDPGGARAHFGSLLIGLYGKDGLMNVGRVGSGFDQKELDRVYAILTRRARDTSPFINKAPEEKTAHWVEPDLVCEVKYANITEDGQFRFPTYLGLREDKYPRECTFADPPPVPLRSGRGDSDRAALPEPEYTTAQGGGKTTLNSPAAPRIQDPASASDEAIGSVRPLRFEGGRGEDPVPASPSEEDATSKSQPFRFGGGRGEDPATPRGGGRGAGPGPADDSGAVPDAADVLLQPTRPNEALVLAEGARVKLTNLNKVYWPAAGKTKGDLIAYYLRIAPAVLPILKDRPLILQRYPNGVDAPHFFQHDVDSVPDYVTTFTQTHHGEKIDYLVCNNLGTLLYIANLGAIPLHPLPYRATSPDHPDWIVFDLDPEKETPYDRVCELALALRDALGGVGLTSWAKTSGSEGMHVYVPVQPHYSFTDAVGFATLVAHIVQARLPKLVTLERMTAKRKPGQIYLDCLQNAEGKSVAGPYSARATKTATVSMPLTWSEVEAGVDPHAFTLDTVPNLVAACGDPWAGILDHRQALGKALEKLV